MDGQTALLLQQEEPACMVHPWTGSIGPWNQIFGRWKTIAWTCMHNMENWGEWTENGCYNNTQTHWHVCPCFQSSLSQNNHIPHCFSFPFCCFSSLGEGAHLEGII